jgi:hypothetical protein
MSSQNEILNFLEERLCAHEGGGPPVIIAYDDATFHYQILQDRGNYKDYDRETLGSARSLNHAFELAISGKKFDYE